MYAPTAVADSSGILGTMPQRSRRTVPPLNAAQDFKQFDLIAAERDRRMPRWKRAFNFMMPDRTAFEIGRQAGETPCKPVDSYPAHALQRGVGKLISVLFPPGRVWFEFVAGDKIPEQQHDQANAAAEFWRDQSFGYMVRSGFDAELEAMMPDAMCAVGELRIERGPSVEEPCVVHATPLNELYPIIGPNGATVGRMRKYECEAAHVEELFAGPGRKVNIPIALTERAQTHPQAKVWLLEIYRTLKGVGQRTTVYWCETKEVILDHVGMDPDEPSASVLVPWRRVAGAAYGLPGPVDRSLETVEYYNHRRDVEAKAGDRRVDPATLVDTDAGLFADTFQNVPRAVIPYSSALMQGRQPVQQLTDSGNVNYEKVMIADLKEQIDEMLFASRVLPPVGESHQMTAAEIRVREQQQLREDGVDFAVFNSIVGEAVISRYLWVLQSWGLVPKALKVNGRVFRIRYAGPLSTAQDSDDAVTLEVAVQTSIATVGMEITSDRIRLEDVPGEILRKRNAPSKLIRTQEEGDQREHARIQAMIAQAAADAGVLPEQQAQ